MLRGCLVIFDKRKRKKRERDKNKNMTTCLLNVKKVDRNTDFVEALLIFPRSVTLRLYITTATDVNTISIDSSRVVCVTVCQVVTLHAPDLKSMD